MPFSTLPPRPASFQWPRTSGGIHRAVTERLLPSTVYISVYLRHNVKSEINMFRHAGAALLAQTDAFQRTIFPRFSPGSAPHRDFAEAGEVIR